MGCNGSKPIAFNENYCRDITPNDVTLTEEKVTCGTAQIHVSIWKPKAVNNPKGLVVCLHGILDHGLKHMRFAHALCKKGYIVVAPDYPYHGQTIIADKTASKGYIKDGESIITSTMDCVTQLKNRYKLDTTIGFAHSMGGVVALNLLRVNNNIFDALLTTGPGLVPGPAASSPFGIECLFPIARLSCTMDCVLPCMSALDPSGPLAPIKFDGIVSHPLGQEELRRDPYRGHVWINNKTGYEFRKLQIKALDYLSNLNKPFIVMFGRDDRICLCEGGQKMIDLSQTPAKHKRFELIDGKHDVLCEPGSNTKTSTTSEMEAMSDTVNVTEKLKDYSFPAVEACANAVDELVLWVKQGSAAAAASSSSPTGSDTTSTDMVTVDVDK